MKIERVEKYSDFILEGINLLLPQFSKSSILLTKDSLEQILKSDSTHMFIASDKNTIYGTLSLVIFKIPTGTRAFIEDVVVSEASRGKGVGLLLVNAAISLSRTYNCKTIDLTSRPTREAANQLYKKAGFKERETNVYRIKL